MDYVIYIESSLNLDQPRPSGFILLKMVEYSLLTLENDNKMAVFIS